MNDVYVECLVKQKTSLKARILQIFLIVLAVIFFFATPFVYAAFFLMLLAAGGAYLVYLFTNLEYEYLYLDRELTVDKVMARSRRKRIGTYGLDRIEIMAPVNSHRLDSYKNRPVKVKDYSVGEELQPDLRYAMYFEGGEKIILSPSPELIKAMKNAAPRKIFSD